MIIGNGAHRYEWQGDWAKVPDSQSRRDNGRTHGTAVTKNGNVVVFRQADPAVLIFDARGNLQNAWGSDWAGAHGLTLVSENGAEYLWLTDERTGQVAKTTLGGRIVQKIEKPDIALYRTARYSPTWVAVHPRSGDIWVADGYGSSYIHRYNARGGYLSSIKASDGAIGGYACPHGIYWDTRRGTPELYVTDRSHRRIQVCDEQGNFRRVFGSDYLNSPCYFAAQGKNLVVPELFGRVAVLDENDRLVTYLGENYAVSQASGWPGSSVAGWPNLSAAALRDGQFCAPHGVATHPNGDVYIVEWIQGGRITRLKSLG